jgi:hypothetical protein
MCDLESPACDPACIVLAHLELRPMRHALISVAFALACVLLRTQGLPQHGVQRLGPVRPALPPAPRVCRLRHAPHRARR